jgi:hypothetical protein
MRVCVDQTGQTGRVEHLHVLERAPRCDRCFPVRLDVQCAGVQFLDATVFDDQRGLAKHPAGGGVEQACAVQHTDIVMGRHVGGERGSRQRKQDGGEDERATRGQEIGSHGR